MNYRHAYHAGSHTEVFKHSVLVLLLQHLLKKPRSFMVLDTHAGTGIYDLAAEEAQKTGEALDGIGRVINHDVPTASAYLDLVRRSNPDCLRTYPGSPAIVQSFLRENDRLTACELREDEAALLRATFKDRRLRSLM
jgi:23S rRNA (adenine2030-N6)-methyltransferase